MSGKPFDASLKDVFDAHPEDWARLLGARSVRSARVIDADVSTVSAAADKAMVIESDEGEYLLHPELQSSYDAKLPRHTWWCNSVLHQRLHLPVSSTVVLLRPQADGPEMHGQYNLRIPMRPKPYHVFEYDILRRWELPGEKLLSEGIGIVPVAPLADDAATRLPEILQRIDDRLKAELRRDQADKLRAATSVLMGLRHSRELIDHLLEGIWPMWKDVLEDSSVIQYLKQQAQQQGFKLGEDRGVKLGEDRACARFRETLLRVGAKRFGSPDPLSRVAVENLSDADRLATLSERIFDVNSWQELLA